MVSRNKCGFLCSGVRGDIPASPDVHIILLWESEPTDTSSWSVMGWGWLGGRVLHVKFHLKQQTFVLKGQWRCPAGVRGPPGSVPCSTALAVTYSQTSCLEILLLTISTITVTSCWLLQSGKVMLRVCSSLFVCYSYAGICGEWVNTFIYICSFNMIAAFV